jgi:hypothetical protein
VKQEDQEPQAAAADPGEAMTIIIPVSAGRAQFRGSLVRQVSSRIDEEDEHQERFTVISLYRVAEGSLPGTAYVISSIGRSVRYHALDGGCLLGTIVTVAWLLELPYYDKLVECRRCHAPDVDDLRLTDRVRYEKDRVNPVIRCRSAADVRERLHEYRTQVVTETDPQTGRQYKTMTRVKYLSAPAERLLYDAAEVDPAFAALLDEVVPLAMIDTPDVAS